MDKLEAIKKHRKMWSWLVEHPLESKDDYFAQYMGYSEESSWPWNECYGCEYDRQFKNCHDYINCANCPFIWPSDTGNKYYPCQQQVDMGEVWASRANEDKWGLWWVWLQEVDYDLRRWLATLIRDLPVKEGR